MVDIMNHTRPDEIVVVDDYSQDSETLDGLSWWALNLGGIRIIRPIINLGFLKASNYGMNKAKGDVLCLISSDVRVEDDLATIVVNLLNDNPKRLIGGTVYRDTTGWNEFDGRIFQYAEGWMLACTKEAWQELGGFDERYAPSDYEDIDLSTNALSKGYELVSLDNPNIRHLGGRTIGYSEDRLSITERNREKFKEKWIR
jgi:O-antigen biosynthesis protein